MGIYIILWFWFMIGFLLSGGCIVVVGDVVLVEDGGVVIVIECWELWGMVVGRGVGNYIVVEG